MLPVRSCDTVTCLSTLVGLRSTPCIVGDCPKVYVEDLDGIDLEIFTAIAKKKNGNGVDLANSIINAAAREMMGDLDLLINNGASLQSLIGSVCSTCDFTSIYVAGGGIKITNVMTSNYALLKIDSLKILTNGNGANVLVIDDGVLAKNYAVNLIANTIIPLVNIGYSTTQKTVRIYLQDVTIGMAQIVCPPNSSCGCGGISSKADKNTIVYTGSFMGMDNSVQYGIIACAVIQCSNEMLMCEMINAAPGIFGLTLLYKIGIKINVEMKLSLRNNRVASMNDDDKVDEIARFTSYYNKRMNGSKETKGIRNLVSDMLKQKRDNCVKCDSLFKTGYATG